MPRPRRLPAPALAPALAQAVALLCGGAAACGGGGDDAGPGDAVSDAGAPDVLPVMRNAEPPFHYPPDLYARKIQANVTLRLFIDSLGAVRPESTTVAETSGHGALDSAAVAGSRDLQFTPARRAGRAVGVVVKFPILFRHPEAGPGAGGERE
jgi:TonB family protein